MNNSGITVREVATQVPAATRLFEAMGIDYCCGGNQPLTEACASAGVKVDDVMRMLQAASQADTQQAGMKDFQNLSVPELIAHIVDRHHVFTRQEMARLQLLTRKVIAAHAANHPELGTVGALFDRLYDDLTPHMLKEERVLFPYIIELVRAELEHRPAPFAPFGTVNNPVRKMMSEHDSAGEILRELRAVTSGYTTPADGCISYRTLYEALNALEKDLHQHIHLENNILFPRAVELEQTIAAKPCNA